MKWCTLIAVMLLASCRCGPRDADARGGPAAAAGGATTNAASNVDETYDMALAVDQAIVEMLSDRLAQPDVLRNAALVYREENGRWPRGKDDIGRYVFNVDRYDSVTFTPKPGGEVVVEWVLKGSRGRGGFTIPPRDLRNATTMPASVPAG